MFVNRTGLGIISALTATGHGVRFAARAAKEESEIYVYDAIGSGYGGITAKDFAVALKDLKGSKSIAVRINSPGGDVQEALAIYNLIKDFRGESTMKIDGLAASAASVLAMAGDRIITAATAMWMIHEPWGMVIGGVDDMLAAADALDKAKSIIVDVYAKRTGANPTQLSDWMRAETWMTAEEAKARGFSDEIDNKEPTEEADKKTAAAVSLFAPHCYPLLAKFRNTPAEIKDRGEDSVRLAGVRALALKLQNDRPAGTK